MTDVSETNAHNSATEQAKENTLLAPRFYRTDYAALDRLERANGILSVWTSANAMNALSQRLPPATWFRVCQGDWLVISDRLRRLARAYGPPRIHLAGGPGNDAIVTAVRALL